MEEHIYFPQRFGINPDLNSNTAGSLSNVAFQFARLETRFLESCGFLQLYTLFHSHPVDRTGHRPAPGVRAPRIAGSPGSTVGTRVHGETRRARSHNTRPPPRLSDVSVRVSGGT